MNEETRTKVIQCLNNIEDAEMRASRALLEKDYDQAAIEVQLVIQETAGLRRDIDPVWAAMKPTPKTEGPW
jgi:hypothetical protein